MKKKPVEFPDEIVLGIGYPSSAGSSIYKEIGLSNTKSKWKRKNLKIPEVLFDYDAPKYELILRQIK